MTAPRFTLPAEPTPRMWGITDEAVQVIRSELQRAIDVAETHCADSGCLCNKCGKPWRDALHELNTSLHDLAALARSPADVEVAS